MRRENLRQCLVSTFFLTFILFWGANSKADTFTVNSNGDAGVGTLRQAITDANNHPGADIINFDPALASPISLLSSLPDVVESVDIQGPGSGALRVQAGGAANFSILTMSAGDVTIFGLSMGGLVSSPSQAALRIVGTANLALMDSVVSENTASQSESAGIFVATNGAVILDHSTLSGNMEGGNASCGGMNILGGAVAITNGSLITGNSAVTNKGGGICLLGGGLLIDGNSQFTLNTAKIGGAIATGGTGILKINGALFENNQADGLFGGAIVNEGGSTTIEIQNAVFNHNSATEGGGAIADLITPDSSLTISQSTFTRNTAKQGGAIFSDRSTFEVDQSTFGGLSPDEGNSAEEGGAIFSNFIPVNISNSTFAHNQANGANNGGGAILNRNFGELTVVNSTFFENSAAQQGGAILNLNVGDAIISATTFSGNEAGVGGAHLANVNNGVLSIQNSILGGTGGGSGCQNNGTLTSLGNNLDSGSSCGLTGSGDISNTDPLLDPAGLADNGGPTPTIALQANSPALDKANPTDFEPTDQRGINRPQGSAPDMGAFELEQAAPPPGGGGCHIGQSGPGIPNHLASLLGLMALIGLGVLRFRNGGSSVRKWG